MTIEESIHLVISDIKSFIKARGYYHVKDIRVRIREERVYFNLTFALNGKLSTHSTSCTFDHLMYYDEREKYDDIVTKIQKRIESKLYEEEIAFRI